MRASENRDNAATSRSLEVHPVPLISAFWVRAYPLLEFRYHLLGLSLFPIDEQKVSQNWPFDGLVSSALVGLLQVRLEMVTGVISTANPFRGSATPEWTLVLPLLAM